MEDHSRERAYSGQVTLPVNRLVVCIEDEGRIRSILLVESTENQNRGGVDLVGHRQVTGHPIGFVLHINHIPDVSLDIVALAQVRDLLRAELDTAREDVDELGVENAACCRVPGDVQVRHSDPLISSHVVILTCLVEVLGIVATDNINAVLLALVDGSKVRSGVVQVGPMLKHTVLLDVLQHPITADILLHAASDTVQASMVRDYCPTELRNIVFEVYQVFALLVRNNIVKVDILVSPFEVMDDAFVCQLFLHDEDVLEKVNDALIDIKVIEFSNHGLLVFQVTFVLIDKGVPFVDDTPDVIECLRVRISLKVCQSVI